MVTKELDDIDYSQIFISGSTQVDLIERQLSKNKTMNWRMTKNIYNNG